MDSLEKAIEYNIQNSGTSDNRITELEAYVILAVTNQEVLQADNLTTVQKEGIKCIHIFI